MNSTAATSLTVAFRMALRMGDVFLIMRRVYGILIPNAIRIVAQMVWLLPVYVNIDRSASWAGDVTRESHSATG